MDLEKRVNMLEQEVQILKNEIQATLLDIQSQLLTNAHPMLRTMDHGHDDHDSKGSPANITAFKLPNAPLSENEEPDDAPTLPSVRRVNLGDLSNNNGQQQPEFSNHQPQPSQSKRNRQPNPEFTSQDDYEAWVKAKLNELGFQRTRELILLYQDTGRFDYDTSEMLLRLIMLYAPRPNHEGASGQQPQRSARPASQPIKQKKSRTQKTSNRPQSKRRPPQSAQSRQEPSVQMNSRVREPAPVVKSESEEDEGRGVVLKLIAGVQSAGIGLKRGLTGSNG